MTILRPLALAVLCALPLAGCGDDPEAAVGAARIEVLNTTFQQRPSGDRVVEGQIVNLSDVPVRGVLLTIGLYDGDNLRIGEVETEVRGIAPGDTTAFLQIVDSRAEAARVTRSVAF